MTRRILKYAGSQNLNDRPDSAAAKIACQARFYLKMKIIFYLQGNGFPTWVSIPKSADNCRK